MSAEKKLKLATQRLDLAQARFDATRLIDSRLTDLPLIDNETVRTFKQVRSVAKLARVMTDPTIDSFEVELGNFVVEQVKVIALADLQFQLSERSNSALVAGPKDSRKYRAAIDDRLPEGFPPFVGVLDRVFDSAALTLLEQRTNQAVHEVWTDPRILKATNIEKAVEDLHATSEQALEGRPRWRLRAAKARYEGSSPAMVAESGVEADRQLLTAWRRAVPVVADFNDGEVRKYARNVARVLKGAELAEARGDFKAAKEAVRNMVEAGLMQPLGKLRGPSLY